MPYADPAQQSAYQVAWMQRRREAWFADNGPCVDCGSWEQLELDHRDSATKVSHRIWSWSDDRRLPELEKCVARCAPCHDVKTTVAGEHARGETNGRARFTADDIRDIRRRAADGETLNSIGVLYSTNSGVISKITRRVTWKHIN